MTLTVLFFVVSAKLFHLEHIRQKICEDYRDSGQNSGLWIVQQGENFHSFFNLFCQRLSRVRAIRRRCLTRTREAQRMSQKRRKNTSDIGVEILKKLATSNKSPVTGNNTASLLLLLVALVVGEEWESRLKRELSRQALLRCEVLAYRNKTDDSELLTHLVHAVAPCCESPQGTVFDDAFPRAVCISIFSRQLGCSTAAAFCTHLRTFLNTDGR